MPKSAVLPSVLILHVAMSAACAFSQKVSQSVSLQGASSGQSAQLQSKPSVAADTAPAHVEVGGGDKKSFEAASIRPGQKFFMKGWDFLNPVNKTAPKGGLFSWNMQIGFLISFAYDLRGAQVSGGMYKQLPQWAKDEWYAVEARADGNPSRDDVRQMVRSLLEDRFKLVVHSGTHEGQVNALTVVRPGIGLKSHVAGADCAVAMPPATGLSDPYPYPSYNRNPVQCGLFDREMGKYKRRIEMVDVSMAQIADTLSDHSPLPVVDATGMTGHYDGFLDYGPEMPPPGSDPDAEMGSPVAVGVQKQLGMKLVKQNATVDYFQIDHIEKPSEN